MADRSSAVKAMRGVACSPHGSNSCLAIVLRRSRLRATVASYAAESMNSPRPERLLSSAGELEEIVAQHADHTEGDRDEHRERRLSHRRLATPTNLSPGGTHALRAAERPSSAAAAALSDSEFRETSIAAAVCCSGWLASTCPCCGQTGQALRDDLLGLLDQLAN